MKKLATALLLLTLAMPLAAAEWKGVTLMDTNCSGEEKNISHPEDHTASCAMKCGKSGYGAIIDGKYVKFDAKGDKLAAKALKSTRKKDHLTATVNGEMKNGKLAVSSLKLD